MVSTEEKRVRYTTKVDILSFGIVAHILLLGYNPLKGKSYDETFQKNKAFNLNIDRKGLNEVFGEECGDFFERVLARLSSERLSAYEALNHPFMTLKSH